MYSDTTATALLDRPVDDVTRRRLLAGTLGATALLGMAACGDSSAGPVNGARGGASTGTRQVSTIHGSVDVPADPKRVVTVSFVGTANLLDLGVTPVGGVTGGVDFLPAYRSQLDGMTTVADNMGTIDLEAIAALRPDVIVGSDWPQRSKALLPYDKLSRIAPTAVFEQAASVANWEAQAAGYASAVNRADRLGALRDRFAATQRRIRTRYADLLAGVRWEVVNAGEDAWFRYSVEASHCKVLAGAGCRFTAAAQEQPEPFTELSLELLGDLDSADAIGLGRSLDADWSSALRENALFRRLPAVASGRLYDLNWFFPSSYGTAIALLAQLEVILGDWAPASGKRPLS